MRAALRDLLVAAALALVIMAAPALAASNGGWFFDPATASVGDKVAFYGIEGEEFSGQLCPEMALLLAPAGVEIDSREDRRLTPAPGTYRAVEGDERFIFIVPDLPGDTYTGWFWCDAFSGHSTDVLAITGSPPATDALPGPVPRDHLPAVATTLAAALFAFGATLRRFAGRRRHTPSIGGKR